MDVVGNLTVTAIMALIAAFLTQAVKQAIPDELHRYIPIPLALVCVGLGVLLAYLQAGDMVTGGLDGVVAAALAVYGYQAVKGFVTPPKE